MAYSQLVEARKKNQSFESLNAAERFVEAAPARDHDVRLKQVLDWYAEAFSRWFVRHAKELDDEAKAHVERYHNLMRLSAST